jgi:Fur family ferric uptake transcriptional regulator
MLQKSINNCDMSTDKEQQLAKILKDAGHSLTTPRKLIFSLLNDSEPRSMPALQKRLQNKIDRASLYRAINLFEQLGIVQRVNIGWKYKLELTDIFNDHHHHISCLGCGKTIAIEEDEQVERLIHAFSEKYGITAEHHQLEIQGYCKNCLAASTR